MKLICVDDHTKKVLIFKSKKIRGITKNKIYHAFLHTDGKVLIWSDNSK